MAATRRTFLEEALAAGIFSGLMSSAAIARAETESDSPPLPTGAAGEGLRVENPDEFWTSFFDSLDPTTGKSRGLSAAERQVESFHAGPSGLRYAYDVGEEELLDHPGDVQVSMVFGQFRPGSGPLPLPSPRTVAARM